MKLSNNLIVLIHCLFDILVNEVHRLFSSDKNGSDDDDDPEDHPDDDDARPEGKDDDEFDVVSQWRLKLISGLKSKISWRPNFYFFLFFI